MSPSDPEDAVRRDLIETSLARMTPFGRREPSDVVSARARLEAARIARETSVEEAQVAVDQAQSAPAIAALGDIVLTETALEAQDIGRRELSPNLDARIESDRHSLFLVVESEAWGHVFECRGADGLEARRFAVAVKLAARRSKISSAEHRGKVRQAEEALAAAVREQQELDNAQQGHQ